MAFFGIGFFFFVFVSNLRFERPPLLSLPLDLWQEKGRQRRPSHALAHRLLLLVFFR